MAEQLSNNATGTLSAGITNVATTLTLGAGQGAAFPSTGNFRILIDSELMLVGARAGDVLSSITRAIEGTAAAAHSGGAAVTQLITAAGLLQYIQDSSVQKPASVAAGDVPVWDGTTWVRSGAASPKVAVAGLAPGANGQYLSTVAGATAWTTPPVIAPTILKTGQVNAQAAPGANNAFLIPIAGVVVATALSRFTFWIQTQSGNMDLGIYYSDDEITFTRLFSTGTFATPAGGFNTKTFAQQILTPALGRRWYFAVAFDNGTASIGVQSASGTNVDVPCYTKGTSFVLPASISSPTVTTTIIPVVHGHI